MSRRVTFLLNMLSPYWVPFYQGLANTGWNVSIRVSTLQEPNRTYDRAALESVVRTGVDLAQLPGFTFDLRRLPVRTEFAQLPWRLGATLDALGPDVVVSNQLGIRTLKAVRWGSQREVPVIPWVNATTHTERANSGLREAFRRRLVSGAPCVFTNGTEGVSYAADVLAVDRSRIIKVPYAVSAESWAAAVHAAQPQSTELRRQLGLDRLVLIYVGQMIPRKGLWPLIHSFSSLSPVEAGAFDLLAVGGEPAPTLRRLADRCGVRVIWHPFVQPKDLPLFLGAADCLVLPSLEDEWGIVLNEGAAAGLPLLASKYAGATADLLEDGQNGFVIDPLDRDQMLLALRAWLAMDSSQRETMTAASLEVARSRDLKHTLLSAHEALKSVTDNWIRRTDRM